MSYLSENGKAWLQDQLNLALTFLFNSTLLVGYSETPNGGLRLQDPIIMTFCPMKERAPLSDPNKSPEVES